MVRFHNNLTQAPARDSADYHQSFPSASSSASSSAYSSPHHNVQQNKSLDLAPVKHFDAFDNGRPLMHYNNNGHPPSQLLLRTHSDPTATVSQPSTNVNSPVNMMANSSSDPSLLAGAKTVNAPKRRIQPVHFTFSQEDIYASLQAEQEKRRKDAERRAAEQYKAQQKAAQYVAQYRDKQESDDYYETESDSESDYDSPRHRDSDMSGAESDTERHLAHSRTYSQSRRATRSRPLPKPVHFTFSRHDIAKSLQQPNSTQNVGHWKTFPKPSLAILSADQMRQLMQIKYYQLKKAKEAEAQQKWEEQQKEMAKYSNDRAQAEREYYVRSEQERALIEQRKEQLRAQQQAAHVQQYRSAQQSQSSSYGYSANSQRPPMHRSGSSSTTVRDSRSPSNLSRQSSVATLSPTSTSYAASASIPIPSSNSASVYSRPSSASRHVRRSSYSAVPSSHSVTIAASSTSHSPRKMPRSSSQTNYAPNDPDTLSYMIDTLSLQQQQQQQYNMQAQASMNAHSAAIAQAAAGEQSHAESTSWLAGVKRELRERFLGGSKTHHKPGYPVQATYFPSVPGAQQTTHPSHTSSGHHRSNSYGRIPQKPVAPNPQNTQNGQYRR